MCKILVEVSNLDHGKQLDLYRSFMTGARTEAPKAP